MREPNPHAIMTASRTALAPGLVALHVLALLLLTGCASQPLPPRITPSQRAVLDTARIPVSVGVQAGRFPRVYAEKLVQALRQTNLFTHVDLLEKVPDARLVATVRRPVYGTATIPVFTILSFGVIPTVVTEEWGESFTLARRDVSRRPLSVELTWRGRTILGWVAGLANLSPDRTSADPHETTRHAEALAARLLHHRPEIEGLLEPTGQ